MQFFTIRRLLTISLCLAISGCAYLNAFLKAAFAEPRFNFKNLNLTDINLGGLNLDTVWQLDNPNTIGISLASVDYALFIDEKQVVAGSPPQGLQIAPQASSDLHFPAQIRFTELVSVVETFLNKDTAQYRAEGSLGIQSPIGVIRLPLAKTGAFEVPKIPQVVFGNPRVAGITLTGATIEFPLTVTNRNSFPLPINGVGGAVSVGGSNIGTIATGDLGALLGKGTRTVSLPLNINFLTAGGAAVNAIRGGSAQLKFDASVQSGPQALPIKVDQLVSFLK